VRSCCSCSEKTSFSRYAGRLYRATRVSILCFGCGGLCGNLKTAISVRCVAFPRDGDVDVVGGGDGVEW
jgi:hypothetical protein